jgi:RNA polymerase sigma-70 factor (ECF subfamily)
LASAPDAEDALQDVFVSLVRNRDRLGQVGNMKAYLFASLRHAAGRILRRRQHTAATELEAAISTAALSSDDRRQSERLWALAASLPAVQLEVLALRIQGELTFKEIADICGISLNTAASRYRYALEKLKLMVERRT